MDDCFYIVYNSQASDFCIMWEELSHSQSYCRCIEGGAQGGALSKCIYLYSSEVQSLTVGELIERVQRERQCWRGGPGPSITSDTGFIGNNPSSNFL